MAGNARSSGYERQTQDWYRESRRAVDALLDVEKFSGTICDPACGSGNIPGACKYRGYETFGSDIIDRGYLDYGPGDFLTSERPFDNFLSNPPFGIAVDFVLHALSLASNKVAILQRTSWLEGEKRYQQLFSRNQLAHVWQFRSRISMPPGDSDAEAKGGSVAFAWFVFCRDHNGPPTLGWLP